MSALSRIIFRGSLALLVCGDLVASDVVEVEPVRGRAIPPISWIDDTGRTRQLSEFAGFPVIILPIYTRCQTACLLNTDQLKKTLADVSTDPRGFRVILFSFDPGETAATLANYRNRKAVPLAWSVARASQSDIDALLESIGFQAGKAGNEFVHPNLIVFLDSNLRIAKWIYGTDYSGRDIDAALKVAAGESDWIGQHSQLLYSLLVFGASILCVVLSAYLIRLKDHRTVPTAL
jgi:protein SCO1/2